ncbi:DUF4879 domain-containing protein [Pseudoalteromonas sp. OANN1]|uniref:DUF4879 domain-containing protein n=1 Tax=Pseudoalteromonas sp. OANN1 TaxID=2954497 RepID=UPI002097C229|nr:DUF4879 domain-containing protein [Pseudoalteromonas sp. OANN1]MCO7200248.1 YolA family protein [Pseudoalteromonas sp. OANN1]
MKKKSYSMLLMLALTSAFSAVAGDIEQGVMKNPTTYYSLDFEQSPLAMHAPVARDEFSMSSAEIMPMAPAQGITYFELGIVRSQLGGDQTISQSQLSTGTNHGGSHLFIYAWQFGYGNPNNAVMNGISKSTGLSEARCGNDLHRCSVGETVTGWLYGWDFSGQESGQVKVSSNSTASPFGTSSDSLYIN